MMQNHSEQGHDWSVVHIHYAANSQTLISKFEKHINQLLFDILAQVRCFAKWKEGLRLRPYC